jgi:hypothetical protein
MYDITIGGASQSMNARVYFQAKSTQPGAVHPLQSENKSKNSLKAYANTWIIVRRGVLSRYYSSHRSFRAFIPNLQIHDPGIDLLRVVGTSGNPDRANLFPRSCFPFDLPYGHLWKHSRGALCNGNMIAPYTGGCRKGK